MESFIVAIVVVKDLILCSCWIFLYFLKGLIELTGSYNIPSATDANYKIKHVMSLYQHWAP